jgi:hypothetical protein
VVWPESARKSSLSGHSPDAIGPDLHQQVTSAISAQFWQAKDSLDRLLAIEAAPDQAAVMWLWPKNIG